MSLTQREFTIMGLIAIMVSVILAVTTGLYIKAGNSHGEMLSYLERQESRLEALESNKAKATAKRFTSDDAAELIACLQIPYRERETTCMVAIRERFNKE